MMRVGTGSPRPMPWWCRQEGSAAVEFAIIAPLLVMMLIEIVDLGLALVSRDRLLAAVAAGAHYAVQQGQSLTQASDAATLMSNVAAVIASTTSLTTITPAIRFNNASDTSRFAACYCLSGPAPSYTATTCGNSCSTNGPSAGKYLSIVATVTYTPLFSLNQSLIPSPQSVTALVRLK